MVLKFRRRIIFLVSLCLLLSACKRRSSSNLRDDAVEDPFQLTTEDLYAMFIDVVPQVRGANQFFFELSKNPALRAKYNKMIESDDFLQRISADGRAFQDAIMKEYEAAFPNEFGEIMQAPLQSAISSLKIFIQSQPKPKERPLKPHEARLRALEATKQKFALPPETNEFNLINVNYSAFLFYRRQILLFELQTIPDDGRNEPDLESWRRFYLSKLFELRKLNFEVAFKAALPKLKDVKISLTRDGQTYPMNFGALDSVDIRFFETDQTIGTLNKITPRFGVLGSAKFLSSLPSGIIDLFHMFVFESKNSNVQQQFADFTIAAFKPSSFAWDASKAAIKWSQDTSGGKHEQSIELHSTNAHDILSVVIREAFQVIAAEVRDNPRSNFLLESTSRDLELSTAIKSLLKLPGKTPSAAVTFLEAEYQNEEAFLFKYRNPSQTHSLAIGAERYRVKDSVAGLEWYGYSISPRTWKFRDELAQVAAKPTLPEFAEQKKSGTKVKRTSFLWESYTRMIMGLRKVPRFARNLVTCAALTGIVGGGVEAVKGAGTILKECGIVSNGGQDGRAPDYENIDPRAKISRELGNSSKSKQDKAKSLVSYHIRNLQIPLSEVPRYFDFEERYLRYFNADAARKLNVEGPTAFTLVSERPVLAGDYTLSVPRPVGFQLKSVQIFDDKGAKLLPGQFTLKITDEGQYGAVIANTYNALHQFRVEADYARDPTYRNNTEAFSGLNLAALQKVNGMLRGEGFAKLADALDSTFSAAITQGKSIDLKMVERAFVSSSVYSYDPPKSVEKDGGKFGPWTKFLDSAGCLFYQCNAANSIFPRYVDLYSIAVNNSGDSATSPPSGMRVIGMENIGCFARDADALTLTFGDLHLRSRAVGITDGMENVSAEYDATPSTQESDLQDQKRRENQGEQITDLYPPERRKRLDEVMIHLPDVGPSPPTLPPKNADLSRLVELRIEAGKQLEAAKIPRSDLSRLPSTALFQIVSELQGQEVNPDPQRLLALLKVLYPMAKIEPASSSVEISQYFKYALSTAEHQINFLTNEVSQHRDVPFSYLASDHLKWPILNGFRYLANHSWSAVFSKDRCEAVKDTILMNR